MPVYVYQCDHCKEIVERYRPIKDRNTPVPCPTGDHGVCQRSIALEGFNTDTTDWSREVLSDRMGVHPDQVSTHRKLHPDIPMNDQGQIVVRNGAEERRINKSLARSFGSR